MDASTISPVAVLRDTRKSALLRTRLVDDMIRNLGNEVLDSGFRLRRPRNDAAYRFHPTSTAPAAMRAMPSQFGNDGRSPRNSTANTATSTTLSLSMGATCDAVPSLRARK